MSRLTPAIIILSFAAVTGALAQSTGTGSNPSGPKPGVWQAPVGHRQPTRSDVPAGAANSNGSIDADDKALDRKIKSICRGC
jgi:hypothetical protein